MKDYSYAEIKTLLEKENFNACRIVVESILALAFCLTAILLWVAFL